MPVRDAPPSLGFSARVTTGWAYDAQSARRDMARVRGKTRSVRWLMQTYKYAWLLNASSSVESAAEELLMLIDTDTVVQCGARELANAEAEPTTVTGGRSVSFTPLGNVVQGRARCADNETAGDCGDDSLDKLARWTIPEVGATGTIALISSPDLCLAFKCALNSHTPSLDAVWAARRDAEGMGEQQAGDDGVLLLRRMATSGDQRQTAHPAPAEGLVFAEAGGPEAQSIPS